MVESGGERTGHRKVVEGEMEALSACVGCGGGWMGHRQAVEAEVEVEEPEEMELEEPIPEEDEEDDEELFREADMPKLPSEPPVLNINLSPASLTFNIP